MALQLVRPLQILQTLGKADVSFLKKKYRLYGFE